MKTAAEQIDAALAQGLGEFVITELITGKVRADTIETAVGHVNGTAVGSAGAGTLVYCGAHLMETDVGQGPVRTAVEHRVRYSERHGPEHPVVPKFPFHT